MYGYVGFFMPIEVKLCNAMKAYGTAMYGYVGLCAVVYGYVGSCMGM